jgi:S-adenosylmethionine/arginine decarboxylase-like enzyme
MLVGSLIKEVAKPVQLNSGLHILSNFESTRIDLTIRFELFKEFIFNTVKCIQLNQVGEAWHNFEGGGFTGVL